jgi:cell division inhibitor SepF
VSRSVAAYRQTVRQFSPGGERPRDFFHDHDADDHDAYDDDAYDDDAYDDDHGYGRDAYDTDDSNNRNPSVPPDALEQRGRSVAGALKKAMVLLGLGQDEDYEDYEPASATSPAPASGRGRASSVDAAHGEPLAQVRTISSRPGRSDLVREPPSARPDDTGPVTIRRPAPAPSPAQVPSRMTTAGSGKPHSIEPRSFNDAKEVADVFKSGLPVIVNLQNVDRELMKRIIDFCAGLTYALSGSISKVANGVFLLTPNADDDE